MVKEQALLSTEIVFNGSMSFSLRVRHRLPDFLHSVNLKYVKLGYHYSHGFYLFTILALLVVFSAELDAFYVLDAGAVLRLWQTWKLTMPRVHPFYVVKCNLDVPLLGLLSALGAGFDIASKAKLDIVRGLGVGGDRIIFANPLADANNEALDKYFPP